MAKFNQNSLKQKKYRATLNRIAKKDGTYGNGDGLDHHERKGGSVVLESARKNRGRKGEGGRKKGVPHDYPENRKKSKKQ